jgi:hypothetical protein
MITGIAPARDGRKERQPGRRERQPSGREVAALWKRGGSTLETGGYRKVISEYSSPRGPP